MTNLEQLKQDLANLTERVNCAMALTDGSIYLTREQLKDLINTVQEQTIEFIKKEIDDIAIDGDDYVELDLCGREIEINFDVDSLMSQIKREIASPNDVTDEEVDSLIEKYKQLLCVIGGVKKPPFTILGLHNKLMYIYLKQLKTHNNE